MPSRPEGASFMPMLPNFLHGLPTEDVSSPSMPRINAKCAASSLENRCLVGSEIFLNYSRVIFLLLKGFFLIDAIISRGGDCSSP
jgi:hypothetical protein